MTITDFLDARITEDEVWAQEALDLSAGLGVTREWRWVRFYSRDGRSRTPSSSSFYAGAPSPAWVLADCEAKRRIVTAAWRAHLSEEIDYGAGQTREEMDAKGDVPFAVAALAAIYADHPDFRPEWRP